MATHIHIEEEDSVALAAKNKAAASHKINIGVLTLPHISNFTDFNALEHHPDVNLFYITSPSDIDHAQILILPSSKNTTADLNHLRKEGFAGKIIEARNSGKTVMGICGGYQMMGRTIADPYGVEGPTIEVPGLGLLPVNTILTKEKPPDK